MTKTEKATDQMIKWALNEQYGYDQANRWGPDFDCSSAVIEAWERAGVPVKTCGAMFTGNMYHVFIKCGFEDVTSKISLETGDGLVVGDVLLNYAHHTAMYCGNGKEVEASINELGNAKGGETGDQTGKEFLIRDYRNYPWNCVLRYKDSKKSPAYFYTIKVPLLKPGMTCAHVGIVQMLLEALHFYKGGITYEMDKQTVDAIKKFQNIYGLEPDGEVGSQTWGRLLRYK